MMEEKMEKMEDGGLGALVKGAQEDVYSARMWLRSATQKGESSENRLGARLIDLGQALTLTLRAQGLVEEAEKIFLEKIGVGIGIEAGTGTGLSGF